ncbi:MAG TPA: SCO2322 family protein, partial [Nocardioidaceae bacterium]|nr:SCO2322 family protein [Nocardioidaceae bacterium]
SAGAANAATGYRYWNYFHVQNGQYAFAKTGAGDYTPKNGAVEAYRYGTSTTSKGIPPRADLSKYDFAAICKGTKAASGQKRVAVIIDYGTKADAPSGETPPAPRTACAAVPSDANGQQVLDAVAQVRQHPYTCGIDGYPASGCSVTVKNATESTGQPVSFALPKAASGNSSAGSATGGSGAGPWPWVALAVICLALAWGAYAMNKRRSR